MESIENSSRQLGYGNTFFTLDKRNSLPEQINHLNSMNAEGAVIFATEMEKDDIPSLSSLKLPYVLLDNDFKTTAIDSVAIDNNLGTYQAIEHLFKKGHKKIGYLQSKVLINSFRERQSGYTEALKSFGLILEPRFHFHVDFSEEGSYHDFKEILNRNIDLPTAFVTDDDTIAAGTIKALCEKGLKVPGDISIIGFDDRPLCEKTSPRLSTIRVPRLSFGGHAINLIVKRIQNDPYLINKNYAIKMRIGTYLVERESVKNFN
jgi:LacI family transcriptional regulator